MVTPISGIVYGFLLIEKARYPLFVVIYSGLVFILGIVASLHVSRRFHHFIANRKSSIIFD